MKLAHIINPVKAPPASDLGVVQSITFETLRIAYEFVRGEMPVELYSVCFEEDHEVIPSFIKKRPNLKRSVLDLGQFSRPKKYPLLMDVLRALYEASDAEFLIFTNMDIAVMPQFYLAVAELLAEGYDALLVNRRGISKQYKTLEQLPLMYSDYGCPHPGFDCFIFRRELLEKIQLANVCVGVSFSEVALVHNLIAFSANLKLVDDLHLTFHIGTEVMPPLDPEYYNHNRGEYEKKIYPAIKHLLNIRKFPYATLPFYKRMLKWVLNPSFRTYQVAEMEGKDFFRRLKYKLDSVRFWFLDKLR